MKGRQGGGEEEARSIGRGEEEKFFFTVTVNMMTWENSTDIMCRMHLVFWHLIVMTLFFLRK